MQYSLLALVLCLALVATVSFYAGSITPSGGDSNEDTLTLILFDAALVDKGARCLDGSPAGYYFQAAPSNATLEQKTSWILFLEGGGGCSTKDACLARAKTEYGSSNYFNKTMTDINNLCNSSLAVNADFARWNRVFVPYCSGDVWCGTTTTENDWGLYFAGHLIVTTLLDELTRLHGLANATNLLISGDSAGGIGTFINADFITEMFPRVNVKATPQGGWFAPNVSTYPDWLAGKNTSYFFTSMELYQAFMNPNCLAGQKPGEEFMCFTIDVLYPFVRTPMFISQNFFDGYQLYRMLGLPGSNPNDYPEYLTYYSKRMLSSVESVYNKPGDALWMPACAQHVVDLSMGSTTNVRGVTYQAALGDWFFGRSNATRYTVDDCVGRNASMPVCNPSCGTAIG